MGRRRHLAVMGDAADMATWSGIPYHFYQAGKSTGFFDEALDLQIGRLRWHRLAWNFVQLLKCKGYGGFQYSRFCLDRTFDFVAQELADADLISHFQLFPPPDTASKRGISVSYYIDLPLTRLFEDYGVGNTIGSAIAKEAIEKERECYQKARFVVAMSSWGARVICEDYKIPPDKVKWILPGANLNEDLVESSSPNADPIITQFTPSRPFRLGYTGKHYQRKGLPRLIEAAEILISNGYPVEVVIVGPAPKAYRRHPAVRWIGFIDKQKAMEQFIEAVKSYDLGCLLSYSEGLGISTLECLRLGVPVMGTKVGGIPDCIPEGAGILLPAEANPQDIAKAVRELMDQPALYRSMRLEARRICTHYSWKRTLRDFSNLFSSDDVN